VQACHQLPSERLILLRMKRTGLGELTIIVPTYRRPQFVLRQFKYWKGSDAKVVVLDGSPEPLVVPPDLLIANVSYVHLPKTITERLASVRPYVTTPYCAMLGDDEFFVFSGLRSALALLDSDSSILGCVGRNLYFFVDQGRFLLKDAYRQWRPFSDPASTLNQRLDEDLPPNKTHMAHYAIMRSAQWTQIMEDAYRQPFSSTYVHERLVNLQRAILGRTVILEDLLWFRSMENRNIVTSVEGGPGFLAWALDPKSADEIAQYRQIARSLLIKGDVATNDVEQFEERFFVGGVAMTVTRKSTIRHRLKRTFQKKTLNWGPKRLRLFAKRHLPAQLLRVSGWEGYGLDYIFQSLTARGTRFEREEIELIRDLSLETARQLESERGGSPVA